MNQFKAARKGNLEWFKTHTYDANLRNKDTSTALMNASRNGHKECVSLLLDAGANVDLKDNYGDTALIDASRNGHKECVSLLLDAGANVDLKDSYGDTALIDASRSGYKECVSLLLDAGANVDLKGSYGDSTALIRASLNGHKKCVSLLLSAGANADLEDVRGETALIKASRNSHKETMFIIKTWQSTSRSLKHLTQAYIRSISTKVTGLDIIQKHNCFKVLMRPNSFEKETENIFKQSNKREINTYK